MATAGPVMMRFTWFCDLWQNEQSMRYFFGSM
jgi:hypothetical protein